MNRRFNLEITNYEFLSPEMWNRRAKQRLISNDNSLAKTNGSFGEEFNGSIGEEREKKLPDIGENVFLGEEDKSGYLY